MRNITDKSCREKAHIVCFNNFFWKLSCLLDNVEKCDGVREATDKNVTWHMCTACWVTEATDTHSEYAILFQGNSG